MHAKRLLSFVALCLAFAGGGCQKSSSPPEVKTPPDSPTPVDPPKHPARYPTITFAYDKHGQQHLEVEPGTLLVWRAPDEKSRITVTFKGTSPCEHGEPSVTGVGSAQCKAGGEQLTVGPTSFDVVIKTPAGTIPCHFHCGSIVIRKPGSTPDPASGANPGPE